MHRGSALVDNLEDLLEGEDLSTSGKSVVLAQRMARIVGALHERALSLQVGGLRVGEGREGDLGELREVEDALGVAQHL